MCLFSKGRHHWILVLCGIAIFSPICITKTHHHNHVYGVNNNNHQSNVSILKDPVTEPTTTPASMKSRDIVIGPCRWVIDRKCPDNDIKFYLYTRKNMMDRQYLYVDDTLEKSNITDSYLNPQYPTKIIIHGYNSDMFLNPLHVMREEYLSKANFNIIYVDWSILTPGPCYISSVHNTKHTGACVAQLIERLLDFGNSDVHLIGFSLGAQVPNYVARNLPTYQLPRITALDPAMPLFITAPNSDKLDPSDAAYVDVIHTNAMVQGKLERCGHADFYMNGGIMQPGCYIQGTNPFACSHQRAPAYFLESIRSRKGFWGWACSSYIAYILGMCPPTNFLVEAGDSIRPTTRGMFFINTNDSSPFALGKWTDLPILGMKDSKTSSTISTNRTPSITIPQPKQNSEPLLRQIDEWGKLDSNFNNLPYSIESFTSDIAMNNWTFFENENTNETTNNSKDNSIEEQDLDDTDINNNQATINANGKKDKNIANDNFIWNEYRQNLTSGFVDNSLFKVPRLQ
ncbi:pancreatic triacylglycerol lipase [Teleopsis dalmanni]|uniref:pancreatic triacylglycerol lipase n=1 Tax=Teleopsis dalmanni TaxID=139649 RepID=UPI0018CDFF8A|nr:pancreatic triacylglycerol lipase [Teleopsis dalmanni]